MPLQTHAQVAELLREAQPVSRRSCSYCDHYIIRDYCYTCGKFYILHNPFCRHYAGHEGHRRVLIPFVEVNNDAPVER